MSEKRDKQGKGPKAEMEVSTGKDKVDEQSAQNTPHAVPSKRHGSGGKSSLESVFKSLTDKVMDLEIEQSLFKKYLEEANSKFAEAIRGLQEDMEAAEVSDAKVGIELGQLKLAVDLIKAMAEPAPPGEPEPRGAELRRLASRGELLVLRKDVEQLRARAVLLETRLADLLLVCLLAGALSALLALLALTRCARLDSAREPGSQRGQRGQRGP